MDITQQFFPLLKFNTKGMIKKINIKGVLLLVLISNFGLLFAQESEAVWRYQTGGRVYSSPAIAGEKVVVGSGDLKETYETLARMHHLQDRVTFVGSVSDEDLPRYYRMADVFVFPSIRRAEAFGIVALEAAASGLPTIASGLPGVRSVVIDGETGLLVTPEDVRALRDAIELLLTRTDLREQLGRSARLHAEAHFNWEPLITNLEQTYKSVLGQQTRREYNEKH